MQITIKLTDLPEKKVNVRMDFDPELKPDDPANNTPAAYMAGRCLAVIRAVSELTEGQMAQIFNEIEDERLHQDEKWGGPEHDDTHSPEEWWAILFDHCDRLVDSGGQAEGDYRERLIKIAAIAVAAIQSWDRTTVTEEPSHEH